MIARFEGSEENILFDAIWDLKCRSQLFDSDRSWRQTMKARAGELVGTVPKRSKLDQPVSLENSAGFGCGAEQLLDAL